MNWIYGTYNKDLTSILSVKTSLMGKRAINMGFKQASIQIEQLSKLLPADTHQYILLISPPSKNTDSYRNIVGDYDLPNDKKMEIIQLNEKMNFCIFEFDKCLLKGSEFKKPSTPKSHTSDSKDSNIDQLHFYLY